MDAPAREKSFKLLPLHDSKVTTVFLEPQTNANHVAKRIFSYGYDLHPNPRTITASHSVSTDTILPEPFTITTLITTEITQSDNVSNTLFNVSSEISG